MYLVRNISIHLIDKKLCILEAALTNIPVATASVVTGVQVNVLITHPFEFLERVCVKVPAGN